MKKIILSLFISACAFMICACNFSTGTNKNFGTGLSYSYSGFAVEKVMLVGPDNAEMTNNEVKFGTRIAIALEGVTNYELKDEKAFPGLMLSVTDKDGKFIVNEADLFADSEGYPAADAKLLRGTVTIGTPMKVGETYHVKMRVWDKNKPASEIAAEVDLVVK